MPEERTELSIIVPIAEEHDPIPHVAFVNTYIDSPSSDRYVWTTGYFTAAEKAEVLAAISDDTITYDGQIYGFMAANGYIRVIEPGPGE